MGSNLADSITLRIPILPYRYNDLQNINDIEPKHLDEPKLTLEYLNVTDDEAKIKYLKRMSYRTTPLHGMVSENSLILSSTNNININKINRKKSNITNHSRSLYIYNEVNNPLLKKSFFVIRDRNYYKYENKEEKYIIERNSLTDFIFDEIDEKLFVYKLELYEKAKSLKIDIELLNEILEQLVEFGFIIVNEFSLNTTLQVEDDDSLYNIDRISDKIHTLNYPKNKLKHIYKIIRLLNSNHYIKKYDELIEYFLDKYNDSHVSIEILFNDKKFMSIANQLKDEVNLDDELTKYFQFAINSALLENKNNINIETKRFNELLSNCNLNNFDVHCNLLSFESKHLINLDCLRLVRNYGNSNIYFNTEHIISLNYTSYNDGENYFLPKIREGNLNINVFEKNSINPEDIYVGLDINRKTFYTVNSRNEVLKFNKLSRISTDLLDSKIRVLLFLSDPTNIDKQIDLNYLVEKYNYIPRITFDTDYIVLRATWKIDFIRYLNTNLNSFINQLDNLKRTHSLPKEVCFIEDDKEILVNLERESDIKYLFNKLRKNNRIILKENIQKYSPIIINNERYCNEAILTFNNTKVKETNVDKKNIYNVELPTLMPFNKWLYFKIYLNELEINYNEFLVELMKKIGISQFYYLFYRDNNNQQYIRFRISTGVFNNTLAVIQFLNSSKIVDSFSILPYEREYVRYQNIGIENFELLSWRDSIRIIEKMKSIEPSILLLDKEEKMRLVISNTLSLLNELKISDKQAWDMLKRYVKGKQNRRKQNNIMKKIKEINYKDFETLFNDNNLVSCLMKEPEEILSLIHLSNNRLIGTDITLEREVYKYIALYFQKKYWRNKSEISTWACT